MPEHWKTVASFTEYMAGNAVYRAAQDILNQLRANGAEAFKCSPEEIEVENGRVYMRSNPSSYIEFKDIAGGYKAQDGSSIGEPVLGRGGFMLKGLTALDQKTGQGKTGPAWTVGAQVVEIEADLKDFTYRIVSASTVLDVGAVINPELMRSMVAGGMAMGVSMASREGFFYDERGVLKTPNLRTYKLMHIGQEPDYRVGFVETPEDSSPYGVRPYSEHGIIGIPAALANALSAAFGKEITTLPLTPGMLWRLSVEGAEMIPTSFVYITPRLSEPGGDSLYADGDGGTLTGILRRRQRNHHHVKSGQQCPGAVIDIKSIPECNVLELSQDYTHHRGGGHAIYD